MGSKAFLTKINQMKGGYAADRDLNAACNIEAAVLRMLAGVGSRTTEMRVERMLDPSGHSAMKRENLAEERQPSRLAIMQVW